MLLYSVKELSNYYYYQTETNIHLALIDINFAKSSRKSRLAAAGEVVDAVDAGGIVLAGVALAFVDVHLAVHAWNKNNFEQLDFGHFTNETNILVTIYTWVLQ